MATSNDENSQQIPTLETQHLYAQALEERKRIDNEKNSGASFGLRSEYDKKCILRNHSVDCMHLSEYLHDYLFPSIEYPEINISPNEKRELNQQLMIKENATSRGLELLLENRNLEEKLFAKKMQLRDSIKKRNETWNNAVKVFNVVSGKSGISPIISEDADTSEDTESSSSVAEDYEAKRISPERMRKEIQQKYLYIQEMSSVLHKLIVFSGIKWAQQKNLLDIVLCTGKILNTAFNKHNPMELEKFVFDCMQRLEQVNWKHIK